MRRTPFGDYDGDLTREHSSDFHDDRRYIQESYYYVRVMRLYAFDYAQSTLGLAASCDKFMRYAILLKVSFEKIGLAVIQQSHSRATAFEEGSQGADLALGATGAYRIN